ncbi:replication factor A protein 3 [Dipodascopsis tothii]|uniref:replication factor A protein 3 n=1 Tax=Dipodascopsis tothii TaxID=44089 RepID=UPI0034CD729A
MSEITPRVNAPLLSKYQDRTVRLVGKVTELRGDNASLDSDGHVTVILNRDSNLREGNACEIIGKVQSDNTVRMLDGTDFGANFDMTAANTLVGLIHKHPAIFY